MYFFNLISKFPTGFLLESLLSWCCKRLLGNIQYWPSTMILPHPQFKWKPSEQSHIPLLQMVGNFTKLISSVFPQSYLGNWKVLSGWERTWYLGIEERTATIQKLSQFLTSFTQSCQTPSTLSSRNLKSQILSWWSEPYVIQFFTFTITLIISFLPSATGVTWV